MVCDVSGKADPLQDTLPPRLLLRVSRHVGKLGCESAAAPTQDLACRVIGACGLSGLQDRPKLGELRLAGS